MNKRKKATVVSLFSGCGGLDLGFKQSDAYELISAYDKDQRAVDCYNLNVHPTAKTCDLRTAKIEEQKADVLIAGPPCQGFSTASGQIEHDDRNDMLLSVGNIAAHLEPKLIIIENVSSLANTRNSGYLRSLIQNLESLGYCTNSAILNASDFGIAQNRKRIFIIARKGARKFDIRSLIKFLPVSTVEDALSGINELLPNHHPKPLPPGSHHRSIAEHIQQGQKLCNVRAGDNCIPTWSIPEVYGAVSPEELAILEALRKLRRRARIRAFGDADPVSLSTLENFLEAPCTSHVGNLVNKGYLRIVKNKVDLKNTFNGKYRRLILKGISPTVDTRFGDTRLFLHPTEPRALTPREAARLQGFPDSYIFPSEESVAYRLIGNAVPPPLGLAVANAAKELLNDLSD